MKRLFTQLSLMFLILAAGISGTKAQSSLVNIDYSFGMNTGDFKEFIDESAFRGGHIAFIKFLNSNENIGIGFAIDWQGFYQKVPRSTFPYYNADGSTNTDLNAVQFRYLYTTPIKLSADYFFVKDAAFLPFVGINAGMQYTKQELNISAIDNSLNTSWDFAYGAQAGFYMPLGESGIGLSLIGKYNGSTYNHTFTNINFSTSGGSYFSVAAGLTLVIYE